MTTALTTADKKAIRIAAKAAKDAALQEAISKAKEALKLPATLSACGIVKTRAWVAIHDKLSRQTRLKQPNIERLSGLTSTMQRWLQANADECNAMTEALKPASKKLS